MNEVLDRYARFIVRRARSVLLFCLAGSFVVAAGATRLVVHLDPEQYLPAENPYVSVDRKIREEFGGKNFVAIALAPRSGTVWRSEVLGAVHGLTLDLLDAPGVIRPNVVSLSSPYVRTVEDRGGLLVVDYLMKEVPTDDAGLAELRRRYEAEPLLRGTVVSEDGRAAMVLADFYDGRSDAEIAATIERAIGKHRSEELEIIATGGPILSDIENALVQKQGFYFLGTVAAILVVLYLAFGQLQGVVLPIATALLSTGAALGFMGWAGIPMNPWTTAVPVIVMTVAAGHSAQMLKRYYEELGRLGDQKRAVIESTRKIGPVMLAAGGTAGSGFAALSVLGIPTLTHFGLGVAAGIFAAVVLEMSFMVALRTLWRSGRDRGEGLLSGTFASLLDFLGRGTSHAPLRVVLVFLGIGIVSVIGLPRLETDVDVFSYWPEDTETGRNLRFFQEHFPGTTTLTILLEGPKGSMKTPEALQLMRGLQEAMESDPGVGRTSSLADIIERTYEVFAPEEAAAGLPESQELVSQLFFLADSPTFERYIDRAYTRSVVLGFLTRQDSALTRRVLERLETHLEDRPPPGGIQVALAGGIGPTLLALNDHTVRGKTLNITVVLAAIFVIAAALLRSLSGGAYVVAPLAMVLLVNLGLFSWLGIAFDLAGASIAAVGIGIGADYAIYFLYRLREEIGETGELDDAITKALSTSGQAILFVALAIAAGFSVYTLSDYYPVRLSGIFVPVTMLVSSLTALTLLPALVKLFQPRFLLGRALGSSAVASSPVPSVR